jgi:hypothetical protein
MLWMAIQPATVTDIMRGTPQNIVTRMENSVIRGATNVLYACQNNQAVVICCSNTFVITTRVINH